MIGVGPCLPTFETANWLLAYHGLQQRACSQVVAAEGKVSAKLWSVQKALIQLYLVTKTPYRMVSKQSIFELLLRLHVHARYSDAPAWTA